MNIIIIASKGKANTFVLADTANITTSLSAVLMIMSDLEHEEEFCNRPLHDYREQEVNHLYRKASKIHFHH